MEPFEIKNLITIKGKSGLWVFKGSSPTMCRAQSLLNEKQITTAKVSEVAAIDEYKIFLIGGERSLESVIDNLITMEDAKQITREELDGFENLSNDDKEKMMEKIVPNFDGTKFKHYHLTKIIKWYKEIMKAIDILNAGVEDPYTNEDEIKTEEA